MKKSLKILCMSDTHQQAQVAGSRGWLPKPGEFDVLVHAGDYSGRGSVADTQQFLGWLDSMTTIFKHVVFIAGNHDFIFENSDALARSMIASLPNAKNIHYLRDSGVELEGFKFWGSPYTPEFYNWAFMYQPNTGFVHWDQIPEGTDVLVTHGPPLGILDGIPEDHWGRRQDGTEGVVIINRHVGCLELRQAVERVKPKVHIFGHIHEGYGQIQKPDTLFVNPSSMDGNYRLVNPPIAVEVTKDE